MDLASNIWSLQEVPSAQAHKKVKKCPEWLLWDHLLPVNSNYWIASHDWHSWEPQNQVGGITVVRDLFCSRAQERLDFSTAALPTWHWQSQFPQFHSSLVYSAVIWVLSFSNCTSKYWKDWPGKCLSGNQSFLLCILQCSWTFPGYYTLHRSLWLPPQELEKKHEIILYNLIHSNGVNSFL